MSPATQQFINTLLTIIVFQGATILFMAGALIVNFFMPKTVTEYQDWVWRTAKRFEKRFTDA